MGYNSEFCKKKSSFNDLSIARRVFSMVCIPGIPENEEVVNVMQTND